MHLRLLLSGFFLTVATLLAAQNFTVTFNVATTNITVAPTGIFIAGGGNFGNPGDNQLTDPDGDGVYSITFTQPAGFESFYTFTNGNCPDYSCKENIAGQSCANPGNFNDRFLPALTGNVVVNTCFGQCSETTSCAPPTPNSLVTFVLDMNNYTEPFTTAYVSGGFNGWAGDANPMADDDGDGVWTATIEVPAGANEFKFQLDQWTVQEMFDGTELCTTAPGEFVNRIFTAMGPDMTLPVYCFNSCSDCNGGSDVTITFNVGTEFLDVSPDGIFIAGGGNFGAPGDNPLTDPDGDGVYSLTITRPAGFTSFYAFANGNCPDFSCKENLGGQACADPNNFNDRFLPPVMSNTVINTCYGQCSETTSCMPPAANVMVTFSLNMNLYAEAFGTPFVAGGFNGWSADANPMADDDGDGIWTATLELPAAQYEFKFQLDMWNVQEMFDGSESCTTNPGEFVNRIFTAAGETMDLPTFCFNSCTNCSVNTIDLAAYGINFELFPTVVNDQLTFELGQAAAQQSTLQIVTAEGKLVQTLEIRGDQRQQLNVDHLAAGFYFVRLQHKDAVGVRRFVKQ